MSSFHWLHTRFRPSNERGRERQTARERESRGERGGRERRGREKGCQRIGTTGEVLSNTEGRTGRV